MSSKIKIPFLLVLTVLTLSSGVTANSADDILIVAHKSVSTNSITTDELKNIFLKKKGSWEGGQKAVPIHAKSDSALRRAFDQKVLKMTVNEEQSFWADEKIRRGKKPPSEFSNTLRAIFSIRGSVSYVYRNRYKQGVGKVLLVIPAG